LIKSLFNAPRLQVTKLPTVYLNNSLAIYRAADHWCNISASR